MIIVQCDNDDFKVKFSLPEDSNECRVIAMMVVDDYFRNREDNNDKQDMRGNNESVGGV